jgi:hypothetical protein
VDSLQEHLGSSGTEQFTVEFVGLYRDRDRGLLLTQPAQAVDRSFAEIGNFGQPDDRSIYQSLHDEIIVPENANVAHATRSMSHGLVSATACFAANSDSMLKSANLHVGNGPFSGSSPSIAINPPVNPPRQSVVPQFEIRFL